MGSPFSWHWVVAALAIVLALAGVVVILLALFRDRAHGRPRCPRCWYSMDGVGGLKCPECGKEARHARQLLRTRRRWRRAAVGLLLLAIAGVTAMAEPIARNGWLKGTPSWMLVGALPWLEPPALNELDRRVGSGGMRAWELHWLMRRTRRALEAPTGADAELERRPALARIFTDMYQTTVFAATDAPYRTWMDAQELEKPRNIAVLLKLMDDPDERLGQAAYDALKRCRSSRPMIIAGLLSRLGKPGWPHAQRVNSNLSHFYSWTGEELAIIPPTWAGPPRFGGKPSLYEELAACEGDMDRMVKVLLAGLDAREQYRCVMCIWGLWEIARDRPEVRERVLALHDSADTMTRDAVIRFAAHLPLTDRTTVVIVSGIKSKGPMKQVQQTALRAAGAFGLEGKRFLEHLREPMQNPDKEIAEIAARSWVKCGGDLATSTRAMLDRIDPADWRTAWAVECLADVGERTPEVVRVVSPLLKNNDFRMAAAEAAVRLGFDQTTATGILLDRAARATSRGGRDVVAVRAFKKAARDGLLDIPLLMSRLDSPDADVQEMALAGILWSGKAGAPALPRLRELRAGAAAPTQRSLDHAMRYIEWAIANPEKAAKLRDLSE